MTTARQRDPDLLLWRLLDALATRSTIDPDTIERLLEEVRDPSRRKALATGMLAAGLATADDVACAFYRWPELRDA